MVQGGHSGLLTSGGGAGGRGFRDQRPEPCQEAGLKISPKRDLPRGFQGPGQQQMEQNPETWRLRPPMSLRCSSGSSSDWLDGSPGEELGTLYCFPWPRAVTGPCPGLSRPRPLLPHCQLQSPPVRPVSCPAQKPLPGACPSPQVRPRSGWDRRRGRGPTGAQA